MWSDIRYAIRGLVRTPGFSMVAIAVLALAVAVNTAIFSVVNALFLRPLPVKNPSELSFVYLSDRTMPNLSSGVPFDIFDALRSRTDVFADGAHRAGDTARLVIDGIERRQSGELIAGNYFQMLGVPALLGRTLSAADDDASAAPAMVISETLWRSEFHADPKVIGRVVPLISDSRYSGFYGVASSSYTIVGVVASPFTGLGDAWAPSAYWVPYDKRLDDMRANADPREWDRMREREGRPILRRRAGVTAAQAGAVIADVGRAILRERFPNNSTLELVSEDTRRVNLPFATGRVRVVPERLAVAMMTVSGLVLLIAIANLIGLFTARGVAQSGETAVRLALGATKARIASQFLAQGFVTAFVSGGLGLLAATQAIRVFSSTAPTQVGAGGGMFRPADFTVPIDWRVWAFGALLPTIAGIVIALARARQASRTDVRGALQSGALATAGASRLRLRYAVVVPQIAAALAILIVAGMFIRALLLSEMAPPGFDATSVSMIDFDMPLPPLDQRAATLRERQTLNRKIREFATTIGGVTSVAVSDNFMSTPLQPMSTWVVAQDDAKPAARGAVQWVGAVSVSDGYIDTLGIRLLRGRDLTAIDAASSKVALVSMAMANALWPRQDPIGKRFSRTWPGTARPPDWIEVVGVVNDVRPPAAESNWNPMFYAPTTNDFATTLTARGPGKPDDVMREIVAAIKAAEPRARITRARPLEAAIAEVRYPRRLATTVLASTGGAGLVLAAIGLFGVVSYSAAQRRREMGIRRALGADTRDIISLVVREGLVASMVGSAAGLLLGSWAIRLANRFALPIPPSNWMAIAAVPAFLMLVVYVACLIPARRAARVDPIVVLRDL